MDHGYTGVTSVLAAVTGTLLIVCISCSSVAGIGVLCWPLFLPRCGSCGTICRVFFFHMLIRYRVGYPLTVLVFCYITSSITQNDPLSLLWRYIGIGCVTGTPFIVSFPVHFLCGGN
jgi:hypothetical protein